MKLRVAFLSVAALSCCNPEQQPAAPERSDAPTSNDRDLILITVDTLRADRLSAYGYERPTSPFLDRLAQTSWRFERALVPMPRTTQSLAALMTSLRPSQNRVRWLHSKLGTEFETLAERFQEADFTTGAFICIPYLKRNPPRPKGLEQGFDHFWIARGQAQAETLTEKALRWLEKQERPVFLWVHYRDPHAPYLDFKEFTDQHTSDYQGRFTEEFHYFPRDPGGMGERRKEYQELKGRLVFGHDRLPADEAQHVNTLYDGEIAYTDRQIEELIEGIRRFRGSDSVVVFTADHGESLGEHDYWYDHGDFLHDTCVRVPLLIQVPDTQPAVIAEQVSTLDIAPTLLEIFGLAALEEHEGRSLAGLENQQSLPPEPLLLEAGEALLHEWNDRRLREDPRGRHRAVSTTEYKTILIPGATPDEDRYELYHLPTDPDELVNLATSPDHAEVLQEHQALLQDALRTEQAIEAPDISEEERALLESVGYLGAGESE
jgi:arylsulfatase